MVRYKGNYISKNDLLFLAKNDWISSDLINIYLKLALWSPNVTLETDKFCVLDSYFYQLLPRPRGFELSSNNLNGHSLGKSLFERCSIILFPINIARRHWIFVKFNRITKIISIFDSLNPHKVTKNYHNADVEENLESFLNCKIPGQQFDSTKYQFEYEDVIQQKDGSNCGPFVILNILDQMNLLRFRIENTSEFLRDIRLIMFHELISCGLNEKNEFILNIL